MNDAASASDPAEIEKVVETLTNWRRNSPSMFVHHEWVKVPSNLEGEIMERHGDAIAEGTRQRDTQLDALIEKYGEAVRRVPGADPRDLQVLVKFGLLRP